MNWSDDIRENDIANEIRQRRGKVRFILWWYIAV